MEAILIPFTVFACIFGIVYVALTTRNKERMALIESGKNASIFDRSYINRGGQLKLGIILVGVGIGITLGHVLSSNGILPENVAFPAMVFLMAGIALIISHLISAREDKKNDQ